MMKHLAIEVATDAQIVAGATSAASALAAWLTNDISLAIFGVKLSIVLAGFAGAMCVLSFLPKFTSRSRMWGAVAVATIAAAYLSKLVLKLTGLDHDFGLAVGFGVGFTFQTIGTWLIASREKILDAVLDRVRGK
jgi:hypothetical protein